MAKRNTLLHPALREAGEQGHEHPAKSSGNQGVTLQGGAKSGALSGDSASIDPDLAEVIRAWPTLPEATRRQVVTLVIKASVHT
jgi:hypothetical protein